MAKLDPELLKLLRSVDTPTVCNAIEVAQGKRGFSSFTRGTMICSDPEGEAMVGFAKTAKIAALDPPTENQDIIKERRMNYYRYMSEVDGPMVTVIEDVDYPDCIGAYWGEINTIRIVNVLNYSNHWPINLGHISVVIHSALFNNILIFCRRLNCSNFCSLGKTNYSPVLWS